MYSYILFSLFQSWVGIHLARGTSPNLLIARIKVDKLRQRSRTFFVLAENIMGIEISIDYHSVPARIFANPEIAFVGQLSSGGLEHFPLRPVQRLVAWER
jgi:hypothetical protein